MKRIIYTVLLAVGVCSCSPNIERPKIDVPERYIYTGSFSQDSLARDSCWWKIFRDPTLDRLIDSALHNNRTLAEAASRIEIARKQLDVARAEFLPSFDVAIEGKANYTRPTKIVQEYFIEPSVSWEIPLFGQLKYTTQSAQAQISAAEWAYRGVWLTLTAQVATTYFNILGYKENLAISEQTLILRSESSQLIDSMFKYGMATGVARWQSRSLVLTSEAEIPLYRRAVEQSELAMCALLGSNPQRLNIPDSTVDFLDGYEGLNVPIGVPSDILKRRPDIMQSHFTVQSRGAAAGLARSARFPSIPLTASGGVLSNSVKGLFTGFPWSWNAMISIAEPIFNFNKLKRQEQIAVEEYYESVYAYEQSLFQAFSDVESSLVAIETYRQQIEKYKRFVAANDRINTMTTALYRNGMASYLNVIDSERALYASQMQLVNLVVNQYTNYITLCKSLGGGWWSE